MADALPADELGETGEKLFGKLCAQARLICNQADRDRAGWDFRVEFPMPNASNVTLDQREARVCLVQLKCTAGESRFVKARLSSMERLAKERGPAAIVIFRMQPDGTELMGYVIHLIDKELGKVLHRLRVAERNGRKDVNHLSIAFDYHKGKPFKPTADGLLEALSEICPENFGEYVETKQRQFATLGYENGQGLEGEALIWIESEEHLIKIISGIAPLKPIKLQTYDRRFGIRVPYNGPLFDGIEEFSLGLPEAGPCSIVIRAGPLRPAAVYMCEAFVPYPVRGGPILVIRHPLLNLLLRDGSMSFEGAVNFDVGRHDLATWILLLRGFTYLAQGEATIELEFREVRIPAVPSPEGLCGPYLDQLPNLLEFVERLQRALQSAGVAEPDAFILDEIWSATSLQMYLDMFFNAQSSARFEFDEIGGVTDEEVLEALYCNTAEFSGTGFTFATKVTLKREGDDTAAFASTRFELFDIRPKVLDLAEYSSEIATSKGVFVVIDPNNVTMVGRDVEA